MASNDYVLVIHGTWNRPEPGRPPKWYQLSPTDDHNFCTRLSEHLKAHGMAEAVWRGHDPGHEFSWSGENAHEDRLQAAASLCNALEGLSGLNPPARVNVVAHSHGGNVLLKAIELYYDGIAQRAIADARKIDRFRAWLSDTDNKRRDFPPELQALMCARLEQDSVLGRVVFLGTPFLEKCWDVAQDRFDWFLQNAVATVKALLTIVLGMYMAGMMWAYIVAVVIKALGYVLGRDWLAGTWPSASIFAWATTWQVMFLVFLLMSIAVVLVEQPRWNTNFYFSRRTLERVFGGNARRIPALVVTARYLDEALLFLSAEPLAHVFIVSRVLNRLRGSLGLKSLHGVTGRQAPRIGENPEALRTGGDILFRLVTKFVGFFLKLVIFPLWWSARKAFLERAATRVVIDALESAAFGLPMEEVRGAHVEVKERPGEPLFFQETLWRTQDLALSAPPHTRAPGDAAERYAHLTDVGALKKRRAREEEKGKETTWQRLRDLAPSICRARNPNASPQEIDAYTEHLARLWFTLEARASELGGSVELVHSVYYSNERVVSAVASFLATGEVPDGSSSDSEGPAAGERSTSGPSLELSSASGNVPRSEEASL